MSLKEADSTNNYLKNLLSNSKPLPEGTVIMAENQYAGRGQMQNGWFAEPGKNLTFSILLKPGFLSPENQFDLNRVVSLGVYYALEPILGQGLKIKWPNDIYYNDNKAGGILIENILQGSTIKDTVAGIGLNVNQQAFPEHLSQATSLYRVLKHEVGLQSLLAGICNNIEAWYLTLRAGDTGAIRQAYLKSLYWLGENKPFMIGGVCINGRIIDVTSEGQLVLEKDSGETMRFAFKQIAFLNNKQTN